MRFSGSAFAEGVESRDIENVRVRVYNLAKTVADCFKYRNKIGLDIQLCRSPGAAGRRRWMICGVTQKFVVWRM
jgi:hypothetical protein